MKITKLFKMAVMACSFVFMAQAGDVAEAYNYSADQQIVLDRMNDLRARNGAGALVFDDTMTSAADVRAQEIVENFAHTRPDGRDCFTVLREFNVKYGACGENIAYGTGVDGEEVYNMWDNSPPHHKNMIDRKFTRVGIGFYSDGSENYWVQLFADGRGNSNYNNRSNNYSIPNNDYSPHKPSLGWSGNNGSAAGGYNDDDVYYCEDCNVPLNSNLVCPRCGAEYELTDADDYGNDYGNNYGNNYNDDDVYYCEDCNVPLNSNLVCPRCGAEYELVDDNSCGSGGCN